MKVKEIVPSCGKLWMKFYLIVLLTQLPPLIIMECPLLLHLANDTAMMSLQILQNRAAKEILDLPFLSSASDALHRLGWKPLCHWSKEHRCSFIYKCINNFIDSDFNFVFNKDVHNYNTRNRENIRIPRPKRRWGQWTVAPRAAGEWNSLDKFVRLTIWIHWRKLCII